MTAALGARILVADVARAVDYYQRVLGLTLVGYWDPDRQRMTSMWSSSDPPRSAELNLGSGRLVVDHDPGHAGAADGGAELVLVAADLEFVRRRVVEAGGRVTAFRVDPQGRRFFGVVDEDGYRWRIVQRFPAA